MTHVDHAWRHRPRAMGGTDPLEFTSGGAFVTYRACTLARPALAAFFPLTEAAVPLEDIIGSLSIASVFSKEGYPQFERPGPFTGLPAETAVENAGDQGAGPNDSQRFELGMTGGEFNAIFNTAEGFAIEGWLLPTLIGNSGQGGGTVLLNWVGSGTNNQIVIAMSGGASNYLYCIVYSDVVGSVGTSLLTPNVWVHVRLVLNRTTDLLKLFLNGALVHSVACTIGNLTLSSTTWMVLNNLTSGGNHQDPANGRLKDLAFYSEPTEDFCTVGGEGGSSSAPAGFAPLADGANGVVWTDVATQDEFDAHVSDATAAHTASAIALVDAASDFTATDVEGALAELQTADEADEAALAAHLADTVDAHDAAAVSVADAGGYFTGTEVEAALQELGASLDAIGETGRWEIVMEDGLTAPPVPVETEAQDDWLYVLVED